jgi:aldehyde dehydrogenase (NAD+)
MKIAPRKRRAGGRPAQVPKLLFGDLWEYAPAPERADHLRIADRYGHFISGEFVERGAWFPSINPATGETLFEVPEADAGVVDRAVRAARRAFEGEWGRIGGVERAKLLYRIGRSIQENARELAILETLDNGKPIRESRDVDVPLAAAHFLHHAGWADKLEYAFPGARVAPLGVVGSIIPWNFPLLMAAWKIAPALATGNTVVLKPAETSPLTAIRLAELMREAGLPPGVVNVVHGSGATGGLIVDHPGIAKIAFTGSTEVGKSIQKRLAGSRRRLTLELGGKGAQILFEDASIDQAVEGVVDGIFFNQGHVCCAGSRLLVQESVLDLVIRKLEHRIATLRVGDPLDKNTDVGAIHSRAQLEKIEELVDDGRRSGARMHQLDCKLPKLGWFYRPTFFTNVAASHRIAREEIFGPVLAIQSFRTPEEAVAKANDTRYGLSAGIWTDKGSKLFAIAGAVRAGVVWGNTFNRFDPASPFGGYQESGFGREGGRQGLSAYVEVR